MLVIACFALGSPAPDAVPGAVPAGGALATAIVLALQGVILPISRMAGDPFVAGSAATAVFGPSGDRVIRTIMIVSALGAVSACQLMAPRVILAMSRDGLMPASVSEVNQGGTPTVATLASTGVALAFVANYLLSFASVFVLRWREPDTPRPYRVWCYPWTTGIALVGSVAFLVGQCLGDTRNSLWSLALLGASYPVYLVVKRSTA